MIGCRAQPISFYDEQDYTSPMRVLAIDPGYGRCGVAVIEKENGKEVYIYSDCIETSAKVPFEERLSHVADECARLIQKFKPESIALERLFFNTNAKTAMQVAEVRGAILHVAQSAGIPAFEYTPGQIKSATAGHGHADKKQITQMIHLLLKIEKPIKLDDEYDAIAVGITHLAHVRGH
jgi:crossover junction endodeoxyribonuclease RuvC